MADFPEAVPATLLPLVRLKGRYLDERIAGRAYFTVNGVRQPDSPAEVERMRAERASWAALWLVQYDPDAAPLYRAMSPEADFVSMVLDNLVDFSDDEDNREDGTLEGIRVVRAAWVKMMDAREDGR